MSKGLWSLVGAAVLSACGGGANTPCPPAFGTDASKTLSVTVGTAAANCLALAKAANADPDKYTVTGLPTGVTYDKINHCLVIASTTTGNTANNPYSLTETAKNADGTSPAN
jgi:Na+-transporting NADH:ubiquinone oxidoreductase subunit NqrD